MKLVLTNEEYHKYLDDLRKSTSYDIEIPINDYEEIVKEEYVTQELLMTPINKKLEPLFVPVSEE